MIRRTSSLREIPRRVASFRSHSAAGSEKLSKCFSISEVYHADMPTIREKPPTVAILAGGQATRLLPITEAIPKSLADVHGEPFIAYQLRLLRSHGVDDVVLCVGHRGHQIEERIADGKAFGLRVRYSYDGQVARGTGGAIRHAIDMLGEEFFVLYGDSYLPCDYQKVFESFRAQRKMGLMTVFRNDWQYDASNVQYEEGQILWYDKKAIPPQEVRHIDYGLGVFRREAFAEVEDGQHVDLADVYRYLLARCQLAGYEVRERFYEIGSRAGLEKFRAMMAGSFVNGFLDEVKDVACNLNRMAIESMAATLAATRANGGRLFVVGVGGSAANASHAVNDFRKLAGMEAYAPTDNVSELTARTNDEGWESVFAAWLRTSRLKSSDAILVLSVGGGDSEKNVSPNLVAAVAYAKGIGATILGIVGRDGGYTAKVADVCVLVPTVNSDHVTPLTEAFQSVVLHLLVSHPKLQRSSAKWEGMR